MVSIVARLASTALGVTAVAGVADAQHYIFGMNSFGKVIVNDTEFYSLPSDFEVNAGIALSPEEEWIDQVIEGADQYHLRLDGLLFKNGARLDPRLPLEDAFWYRLAVSPGGDVFALDFNGRVAQNGVVIYDLPHNSSENRVFSDFLYHQGDKFALRLDGRIYRNASGTEVWDLPGESGSDGERWVAFVYDETDDRIYCLRKDGIVRYVENGGAVDGTFVDDLPDGVSAERFTALVQDAATQRIFAMRFDGFTYSIDPTVTPVATDFYADYPGNGEGDDFYLALGLLDGEPIVLRFDGVLYQALLTEALCQLKGGRYRSVVATTATPVATNVKEFKTVASTYSTKCFPGDLVTFPIFASDVNTEDLTLALVSKPDGSTYDDQVDPPVFSWTPDTVGTFELQVSVTDGVDTPKIFKWKISVKEGDVDPLKNKKPVFQKLKKVQALVGVPISVPLLAYDADGDALTYTVGEMPPGMTFDAPTSTITWTPIICAEKVTVEIQADDGSGQLSKGKIQITVETPFWF